jgi:hypothetical protein
MCPYSRKYRSTLKYWSNLWKLSDSKGSADIPKRCDLQEQSVDPNPGTDHSLIFDMAFAISHSSRSDDRMAKAD